MPSTLLEKKLSYMHFFGINTPYVTNQKINNWWCLGVFPYFRYIVDIGELLEHIFFLEYAKTQPILTSITTLISAANEIYSF